MKQKTLSLTEGAIGSTLLRFAVPFLLASLLQALYGAVDLFVVGQYADSAAVSAVAIGSQLMQTITGIVLGISMGGTVLIGHCIGEKNDKGAAKAVGTITILFIMIAVILTPIMIFGTNLSVSLMHTPTEAINYARQYIFICACGIPFIVGYNAVSGIFRGVGDSKTPMYFIAIACVVNIVSDFILVGKFNMGASGAAIATILAQAISLIISLIFIKKRGFSFGFNKEYVRVDKYSLRRILKVGSPLALQDALVNISFLLITVIVNSMGLIASASVGVVEKIIIFAMLPPTAFASAVATMTAQNMGANKPDRAIKGLKYGIGYSLICGILVCIYCQFLPHTITSIFTKDVEVIASAAMYLKSYSFDCILVAFIFCMNSYFSGCGRSMIAFIHSMIATFVVRIPMSYLMSKVPNTSLFKMGLASPVASFVSVGICFGYFIWLKKYNRQAKSTEEYITIP